MVWVVMVDAAWVGLAFFKATSIFAADDGLKQRGQGRGSRSAADRLHIAGAAIVSQPRGHSSLVAIGCVREVGIHTGPSRCAHLILWSRCEIVASIDGFRAETWGYLVGGRTLSPLARKKLASACSV